MQVLHNGLQVTGVLIVMRIMKSAHLTACPQSRAYRASVGVWCMRHSLLISALCDCQCNAAGVTADSHATCEERDNGVSLIGCYVGYIVHKCTANCAAQVA